jgi:hypothetical protein
MRDLRYRYLVMEGVGSDKDKCHVLEKYRLPRHVIEDKVIGPYLTIQSLLDRRNT